MKAIREINHSEELTFEQMLIANNTPSREFLLIDCHFQGQHVHRRPYLLELGDARAIAPALGKNQCCRG